MIFYLSFRLAALVQSLFARYAPSNIIIRYLRSPRGLKWAFPVSLALTPAYYVAAVLASLQAAEPGYGWLHIFFFISVFSMVKFAATVVISPFWMLAQWWRNRSARSEAASSVIASGY